MAPPHPNTHIKAQGTRIDGPAAVPAANSASKCTERKTFTELHFEKSRTNILIGSDFKL